MNLQDGWRWLGALTSVCALLTACDGSSSVRAPQEQGHRRVAEPASIDSDYLKVLLQRCDIARLTPALADVLGLPSSSEVLAFLADSWDQNNADPELVACMQKDIVRVYVANALAQGQSNRMIELHQLPAVLDALRASLGSLNQEVVQIAMMGLGDFLSDEDVMRLAQIAEGQNRASARVAISTLALSCTPSANAELEKMAERGGAWLRGEISGARQRMQDARQVKCGSASQ